MDLFNYKLCRILFELEHSPNDESDSLDPLSEALDELVCPNESMVTQTKVWTSIIEKCLQQNLPDKYRLAFEKLIEDHVHASHPQLHKAKTMQKHMPRQQ